MAFLDRRRSLAALTLALIGFVSATGGTLHADGPTLRSAAIGIAGEYKLGLWAELTLVFESDEAFGGTLGVEVPDGDGVPVEQRSDVRLDAGSTTVRVPVRLGRPQGAVRVRTYAVDEADGPTSVTTLPLVDATAWRRKPSPLALPAPRPAQERIIVAIGPETGIEAALRALRSRGRADADRVYLRVDSLASLPHSRWGLDAIETVVLAPGTVENLSLATPEQWAALVEWTELGGSVLFVGGEVSQAALGEGGPLAALAPGAFDRLESLSRLRGLETLASVEEPLASIDAETGAPLSVATAFFRDVDGRVISFEGAVPSAGATIVRYPVRFGEATYVAFDLSRAPFAGWAGREGLWREILARGRRAEEASVFETGGRATHLGYDDLAGQLRTTLERFAGIRTPSFLVIVGILVLYLAWIGPGDWFFLQRIVGRMEWTWLTFAATLLLMGVGIVLAADYFRGASSRWNQLDVVDVHFDRDGEALVRGYSWSVGYVDRGRKLDLRGRATLMTPPDRETLVVAAEVPSNVAYSWEGLPGTGVGAMSGSSGALLPLPGYRLIRGDEGSVRIDGVPIQVSSTKAFVGRWTDRFDAATPARLYRSPRNDLLRGEATNPLAVELQDVRLVSGSWIYSLGGDLAPGETWTLSELDSPMNLEWRLKRRRTSAANRDESETWNPTHAGIDRVVEMLMFYRAAGGRSYVADLRHEYYPQLDLSDRLEFPGAMLIGRVEGALLDVETDPDVFADSDRKAESWVRLILPVVPVDPVTGRPIE